MAGLVPAIHVLLFGTAAKTWMPATSAGMTVLMARHLVRNVRIIFALVLAALAALPAAAGERVAFRLITQHGTPFSERDLAGAPAAIFFGFTSCPDVCPTTLLEMTKDLEALGSDGDRIRFVFISVDPETDSPARLKDYLESFDPRIVALTGPAATIAAVARAYGARYRKVATASGHTFEHTPGIFLIDRSGETAAVLSSEEAPASRLAKLRTLVR
jgi:protein SCO1